MSRSPSATAPPATRRPRRAASWWGTTAADGRSAKVLVEETEDALPVADAQRRTVQLMRRPDERQQLAQLALAGAKERIHEQKGFREVHVVVRRPVDEQERPPQVLGIDRQAVGLVRLAGEPTDPPPLSPARAPPYVKSRVRRRRPADQGELFGV